MKPSPPRLWPTALCVLLFAAFPCLASAKTLCVVPNGSGTCYAKIQQAVNNAAPGDIVRVAAGEYDEEVTIGIPLSLLGAGAEQTTIDATNLAHGIFVDGLGHPGLNDVNIIGFTVENAQFEGILVVSAADVVVRDNHVIDNDKSPGLAFNGLPVPCVGQPGAGTYETDESGDCGGAIHFVGVSLSTVSGNLVTGNADGLLISDETAESHDNLVIRNVFHDNPLECGIVLASHPPSGSTTLPHFAPHFGVNRNTITENVSKDNGVQIGGAGIGLFSDGNGPGTVTGNVIVDNEVSGNGLGGIDLHTHVGPAFHAPADNMDGNVIVGNSISKNLADQADTKTPGSVGININSGGGGSPVRNTIISHNVIWDEDVDIAVNDPVNVDFHLNNLLGGKIGVANVCALDNPTNPSVCTGEPDAEENYWGCPGGPGAAGCSTASGAVLSTSPWLEEPIANDKQ